MRNIFASMLLMAVLADARTSRRELQNEIDAELHGLRDLSNSNETVASSNTQRRDLQESIEPPSRE